MCVRSSDVWRCKKKDVYIPNEVYVCEKTHGRVFKRDLDKKRDLDTKRDPQTRPINGFIEMYEERRVCTK